MSFASPASVTNGGFRQGGENLRAVRSCLVLPAQWTKLLCVLVGKTGRCDPWSASTSLEPQAAAHLRSGGRLPNAWSVSTWMQTMCIGLRLSLPIKPGEPPLSEYECWRR
jgi:hypothetical protein